MSRIADFVAAVDRFMGLPKRLEGAERPMEWQPGRQSGECRVKLPIEVEGEQRGQSLLIMAFPRAPRLEFNIAILFPPAVCRLDYGDHLVHGNNQADPLDYVDPIIHGHHFHSWEKNRRFVTGVNSAIKLHNAEKIERIRRFDQALRWFCDQTSIQLPANHTILLPPRDVLL